MAQPLLEGNVDNRDELIEHLQGEVKTLTRDLLLAKAEAARERRANTAAVSVLRNQLLPFYQALKSLFGELDKFDTVDASPVAAKSSAVWETWKRQLGGKQAEFIQAMLDHGHEMTSEQLRVATHTGRSTVPQIIYKLNQLGLINKNGGRFSLKEL